MGNLYTSTTFMEHNSHPDYKYEMDAPTHEHDGINPSQSLIHISEPTRRTPISYAVIC